MNKKLLTGIIAVVFLVSIISAGASTWSGIAGDVAGKITSGFKEGAKEGSAGISFYDNNTQLWDFILFFVLFLSISFLGLRSWLKDEKGRNASVGIAVSMAAALSLAAMKAGLSVNFFMPFVKNALFFIAFLLVFLLMKKLTTDEKHKSGRLFVSFLIALALTYIMFNISGLVSDNRMAGLPWEGTDEEKLAKLKYELEAKQAEFNAFKAEMATQGYNSKEDIIAKVTVLELKVKETKNADDKKELQQLKTKRDKWILLEDGGFYPWEKGVNKLQLEIQMLEAKMQGKGVSTGTLGGTTPRVATQPEIGFTFSKISESKFRLECVVLVPSTITGKGKVKYRYILTSDKGKLYIDDTENLNTTVDVNTDEGNKWNCRVVPIVEAVPGDLSAQKDIDLTKEPPSITIPTTPVTPIGTGDILTDENLMIKTLDDLTPLVIIN